ncbi:MAG: response regulator [Ignavibacteriae bacterium]|nr:response regulator [Ignavibacteriota bacterium]
MASILIIDNEHSIRKDIYDYLRRDGYKIKTTKNGAEGIQLAIANDFEFVMIEQELSNHSGLKVLQAIKKVKPETVCFVIANDPSFEVAVESANFGACSYIPKPLSYEGLSFHLSKGAKHRQLFIEAQNLRKERQNNLLELSREKSMFKTVLNSINGGVLVINTDGELVYHNNASLKYLNLENLEPGEQILQKLPKPIIKQVSEYLLAKNYKSSVSEIELEMIPDNKLFIQSVCTHIPRNKEGFSGIVLVTRNVTKKRELEQVKSQFVSMVAHELKSPLVAVEGFLQILQNPEYQLNEDKKSDFIKRSLDRTKSLFQLVNDLLDISKMEQRDKHRELEVIDFSEVIKNVIETHELEYQKKNIALTVEKEKNLPLIKVEKDEITRLANNLFSNAIKYNKTDGRINISLLSNKSYLEFIIEDSGIGIKESDKPKLFQEFFRAMNKQTRIVSGTGLGLTIVKRIVESYHGKIRFESEYGSGTKFIVKLPINKN